MLTTLLRYSGNAPYYVNSSPRLVFVGITGHTNNLVFSLENIFLSLCFNFWCMFIIL